MAAHHRHDVQIVSVDASVQTMISVNPYDAFISLISFVALTGELASENIFLSFTETCQKQREKAVLAWKLKKASK